MFLVSLMTARYYLGNLTCNCSTGFPLLISLQRSNGFTFPSTKSHAEIWMCASTNVWSMTTDFKCLKRPEHAWQVTSDDSLHWYGAHVWTLLQALHWLHSKFETPLHCKWTSGWLLTHSGYLSGISRCLTEDYQGIQQSSQNSNSPRDMPGKTANSFLPHLNLNLDEAL